MVWLQGYLTLTLAHDVMLLSPSVQGLQDLVTVCENHAKDTDLLLSTDNKIPTNLKLCAKLLCKRQGDACQHQFQWGPPALERKGEQSKVYIYIIFTIGTKNFLLSWSQSCSWIYFRVVGEFRSKNKHKFVQKVAKRNILRISFEFSINISSVH